MTKTNKSQNIESQFHSAEISIQERLGIAEQIAKNTQGFIREIMPEKHRRFFSDLPFVILGVTDHEGYPWPIPMFGQIGFVSSPNETTLDFDGLPSLLKTLNIEFQTGKKIGMLGIQLATRRRNRVNGVILFVGNDSFSLQVEQSFGNCPKYIRKRELNWIHCSHTLPCIRNEKFVTGLDANSLVLIKSADTFFIASRTKHFDEDKRTGIDASHRGGKPGFVHVGNNKLQFPDFKGNGFFNTLGNIESDSRVGLFFPDFLTGNAVFIAGNARILWDESAKEGFDDAQRVIEVNIEKSIYLPDLMFMTEH